MQTIEVSDIVSDKAPRKRHDFLAVIENASSPLGDINYDNEHTSAHITAQTGGAHASNMAAPIDVNKPTGYDRLFEQNRLILQQQACIMNRFNNIGRATITEEQEDDLSDDSDRVASDHETHETETCPMDNIEGLVAESIKENDGKAEEDFEHDKILQSLKEFYENDNKTGPPIADPLAECLDSGFHVKIPDQKAKDIGNLYFRPKNTKKFFVPRTNESVWPSCIRVCQ